VHPKVKFQEVRLLVQLDSAFKGSWSKRDREANTLFLHLTRPILRPSLFSPVCPKYGCSYVEWSNTAID
jgi:hypothetical protein